MIPQIQVGGARAELRAIADELRQLGRLGDAEILLPILARAGQPLAAAMKQRIRRKTGATADSVAVRALSSRSASVAAGGVAAVTVGPDRFHQQVARFLEYGTTRRNRRTGQISHVAAHPFADASLESSQGEMLAVLERELGRIRGDR